MATLPRAYAQRATNQILDPKLCGLSAALASVMEAEAFLDRCVRDDRDLARTVIARIQRNEDRRGDLRVLASALEARIARPTRRRAA